MIGVSLLIEIWFTNEKINLKKIIVKTIDRKKRLFCEFNCDEVSDNFCLSAATALNTTFSAKHDVFIMVVSYYLYTIEYHCFPMQLNSNRP